HGRPLMVETTLYVGLDTDKSFVDVGLAEPLPDGEVRYWGKLGNEPASMDRLVKRLQRNGRKLVVCYEAGPCGYGLYRQLSEKPGVTCKRAALIGSLVFVDSRCSTPSSEKPHQSMLPRGKILPSPRSRFG